MSGENYAVNYDTYMYRYKNTTLTYLTLDTCNSHYSAVMLEVAISGF